MCPQAPQISWLQRQFDLHCSMVFCCTGFDCTGGFLFKNDATSHVFLFGLWRWNWMGQLGGKMLSAKVSLKCIQTCSKCCCILIFNFVGQCLCAPCLSFLVEHHLRHVCGVSAACCCKHGSDVSSSSEPAVVSQLSRFLNHHASCKLSRLIFFEDLSVIGECVVQRRWSEPLKVELGLAVLNNLVDLLWCWLWMKDSNWGFALSVAFFVWVVLCLLVFRCCGQRWLMASLPGKRCCALVCQLWIMIWCWWWCAACDSHVSPVSTSSVFQLHFDFFQSAVGVNFSSAQTSNRADIVVFSWEIHCQLQCTDFCRTRVSLWMTFFHFWIAFNKRVFMSIEMLFILAVALSAASCFPNFCFAFGLLIAATRHLIVFFLVCSDCLRSSFQWTWKCMGASQTFFVADTDHFLWSLTWSKRVCCSSWETAVQFWMIWQLWLFLLHKEHQSFCLKLKSLAFQKISHTSGKRKMACAFDEGGTWP